jgi:hypothetical protein
VDSALQNEGSLFQRRWVWWALLALYLLTGFLYSVIQPLGRCPDEPSHMQYVKFLADNQRFPIWEAAGGGEAGYEAQHPPLYYALTAVPYKLVSPLEDRWQWQILRWLNLGIGCALFFLCRKLFTEFFSSPSHAFAATATVVMMPLTLLYTCHVNPDGLTLFWVSTSLYLCWQTLTRPISLKRIAMLGFVCGLAALTKISGAPILVVALLATGYRLRDVEPGPDGLPAKSRISAAAVKPLAVLIGAFLLTCGWWYARNLALYGTVLVHTKGKMGNGLKAGFEFGFPIVTKLTWSRTYLSTWAQRGWFPEGAVGYTLNILIIAFNVAAVIGLWRYGKRKRAEGQSGHDLTLRMLRLSIILIALVFFGQQWVYWTLDMEVNAGGRYMLVTMAAIALVLVFGACQLQKLRRPLLSAWLVLLLTMNFASAWNIITVLNPAYAPNWEIFHFPPAQ